MMPTLQIGQMGARRAGAAAPPPAAQYYWNSADKASEITLSGSDQIATRSTTNDNSWRALRGVTSHSSGKWYAECDNTANGSGNGFMCFGMAKSTASLSQQVGGNADGWGIQANNVSPAATCYHNGGTTGSGTGLTAGQRAKIAVDIDAGKLWLGVPSGWIGGGDPAAGTSPTYTFTAGTVLYLALSEYGSSQQCTLYNKTGEDSLGAPSGYSMWG